MKNFRQHIPNKKEIYIDFRVIDNISVSSIPTLSEICKNIDKLKIKQNVANTSENNDDASLINKKRENYLQWEEYFMSMAFLAAQRSKDPSTQVNNFFINYCFFIKIIQF